MPKLNATYGQICVARVLHEDDALLTLEVVKDETRQLRLEDGDRFLSLLFIRNNDGKAETWTPWKDA